MKDKLTNTLVPFLLDELRRQGFLMGVGEVFKIRHYFHTLREHNLPISDIKVQLGVLVCKNSDQQKTFYAWFDKWANIIEERTQKLLAGNEEDTNAKLADNKDTIEKLPPPLSTPRRTDGKTTELKIVQNQKTRTGPVNIQLQFPANSIPLQFWNLAEIDAALPALREKKWVNSADWDIPASIRQTIKLGGVPQFVLKQKMQTPQYLILIEQQSTHDHLAAFYAELAEELSRRDLNVSFFYYDISPATCWRERNNPRTYISLEALQGEYADARLFIIGNAETLLKQPRLEPSIVAVSIWETWRETAILSPKSTGDWGQAEWAIGQLFPVVPANGLGFNSLKAQWQGIEHYSPNYWQINSPEPRTPDVAHFTLPKRSELVDSKIASWKRPTLNDENQLNQLYFYLSDNGYRWLCAAALYPEIYYELTHIYADEVIAQNDKLTCWEQNRLWWESLRLLVRLDWFRKGQIPTHWRGLLREDFSVEKAIDSNNDAFLESVVSTRKKLLAILNLPINTERIPKESYAAANLTFTKTWLEKEIDLDYQAKDLVKEMETFGVSISDINDVVGQEFWQFVNIKTQTEDNDKGINRPSFEEKKRGTNYFLGIGIDQYLYQRRLYNCVKDVTEISQVLVEKYDFEDENIQIILDEEATNQGIMKALDGLAIQLGEQDSLIFVYSGHSQNDKIINSSYLIPVEAKGEFEFISFESIKRLLDSFIAKHIFVIFDASSSGFIRDTQLNVPSKDFSENYRSRLALISGRGNVVQSGESGSDNPFTKAFLNALLENNDKLGSLALSQSILDYFRFRGNSQLPQYGGFSDKGNDRGEYYFYSKNYEENIALKEAKKLDEEKTRHTTDTQKKAEKKLRLEKKELQKKQQRRGRLLYNIPTQMEMGKESRCVIRIAYDNKTLLGKVKDASFTFHSTQQDIELGNLMTVTLLDKNENSSFRTRSLENDTQIVREDKAMEWIFMVEPLREKENILTLDVALLEVTDGQQRKRSIASPEKRIEVIRPVNTKTAVVETANCSIYESANVKAKVIDNLYRGTEVSIFEEKEDWCRIGYNRWTEKIFLAVQVEETLKPQKITKKELSESGGIDKESNLERFIKFINKTGLYLSQTRGSDIDVSKIIELEEVLYRILEDKDTLLKSQKFSNDEIQNQLKELYNITSSLVIMIEHNKDSEVEYFRNIFVLGNKLTIFSKNLDDSIKPEKNVLKVSNIRDVLKNLGHITLAMPRDNIEVLQLLVRESNGGIELLPDNIDKLFKNNVMGLPLIKKHEKLPNITGSIVKNISTNGSMDSLVAVIKKFGINLGFKLDKSLEEQLIFIFESPTKDAINSYLDLEHFLNNAILEEGIYEERLKKNEMYIITSLIKSSQFAIGLISSEKLDMALNLTSIKNVVDVKKSSDFKQMVTYNGDKELIIGIQVVQILYERTIWAKATGQKGQFRCIEYNALINF